MGQTTAQPQYPQKFRSLSSSLSRMMIFLAITVLLFSNAFQIYVSFNSQRKIVASRQQQIAKNAASSVKGFLDTKFSALRAAARLSSPSNLSKSEQSQFLNKLLSTDPAFNILSVLDNDKKEVASVSRLVEVASDKDSGGPDLNQMFANLRNQKNYISEVFIDGSTSEPLVVIAVPINNIFGDFVGALSAEVDLKFMWDLVSSIKVDKTGEAFVVDGKGRWNSDD